MSQDLYLRPIGLLYGASAHAAVEAGQAAYLAGTTTAFQSVEILTRMGNQTGEILTYLDVARSDESQFTESLGRLSARRQPARGLDFSDVMVMGIVNTTPDSFSDGGAFLDPDLAIKHGQKLAQEGAHILDIGGESTRPGAEEVSLEEELCRVLPVIEALSGKGHLISIDSRKSRVMEKALEKGACVINDVSALQFDPESTFIAARAECPVVLMHAQGTPQTMQDKPQYEHVVLDIYDWLEARISEAEQSGIDRAHIIADPGIGFGKTLEHNLQLMSHLSVFHGLGVPLLVGASRKRFLGDITGEKDPQARVSASVTAALHAARQGVHIVRVHDVRQTVQALTTYKNIQ